MRDCRGEVNQAVRGMSGQPGIVCLHRERIETSLDPIIGRWRGLRRTERSAALVDSRSAGGAVVSRLKSTNSRPWVFSLEGINPLVVGGHWIPDMLQMAGGRVASLEPGCDARRLQWAEVLEAAPEKLFVDLCSSDVDRHLREVPWLAAQEGWPDMPAVKSGEVYLIDHSYFSCPGPRVVEGLEILAQLTHPELFSGMIPDGVVAKLDSEVPGGVPPERIGEYFRPYP